VQDLYVWKDDHAEKDLEESQRHSGQNALVCRCPFEWDDETVTETGGHRQTGIPGVAFVTQLLVPIPGAYHGAVGTTPAMARSLKSYSWSSDRSQCSQTGTTSAHSICHTVE
jgi:hypothetical protein